MREKFDEEFKLEVITETEASELNEEGIKRLEDICEKNIATLEKVRRINELQSFRELGPEELEGLRAEKIKKLQTTIGELQTNINTIFGTEEIEGSMEKEKISEILDESLKREKRLFIKKTLVEAIKEIEKDSKKLIDEKDEWLEIEEISEDWLGIK